MSEISLAFKELSHHTKEKPVAVKVNVKSFTKKIEMAVAPNMRRGLAEIARKQVHWGIQGNGDLPVIMGVLNFGDPAHTVPNRKSGSPARETLKTALNANIGVSNPSAIPPRPWLSQTTTGKYQKRITDYIEDNFPKVLAGIKKDRKYESITSQRALSIDDFLTKLAEVGAEVARDSWDSGNFEPNADMTLKHKSDPRPLHGRGDMSRDVITGWVS